MTKKVNIWLMIIIVIIAGVLLNSLGIVDLSNLFSTANGGASAASAGGGGGGLP